MLYVSYAEGFKGGGWNSHFNSVLTPAQQDALQKFKPEEAQTVEVGLQARSRRQHAAPERRRVHLRLQGHADHLSRTGAGRRRAVPDERGQGEHRRRELETDVGADGRVDDRSERRLSRCDDRRARQHSACAVLPPGLQVGNAPPYRAGVAGARGHRVHDAHAAALEITPRIDVSYQRRRSSMRRTRARSRSSTMSRC